MGTGRLKVYVYVTHPETNQVQGFGPQDEVPDWARECITNPDVWAASDDEVPSASPQQEVPQQEAPQPQQQSTYTREQLYQLTYEQLQQLCWQAGIELRGDESQQDLVAAITARS